ncbi:di-trans,poly-cis-decaprenylcistransferase [Candidatus Microgenomates bacterium]|nr:MAG: di-trans,poly-cis-decaprenylcistransferase [Candidatus Microgenomates bacterium]
MPQEKTILPKGTKIPNHIAIIPDGNRRWARSHGLHTLEGHRRGFERGVELGRAARRWGVHTVTLWGFSTENWDRSPAEIRYLMKLYSKLIDDYLKDAQKEGVRIIHLGRKDRLPGFLVKKIISAEEATKNNKNYIANIAIDYGGHDDIIRAVRNMIDGGAKSKDITKESIEAHLDTQDQPYPYVDLLIRTSGEQRTSGLLLWQMEYAEMYWEQDHFPDFAPEKMREAIMDYSRRRRRFGGNDCEEHFKFKPELSAKFEVAWWRLGNIPEGTKFRDYAIAHLREQWGLSKKLAGEAAKYYIQAVLEGKQSKWEKAGTRLRAFYKLIKSEVKLAFEPSVVASLDLKLLQRTNRESRDEIEEATRKYVSEVYRISDFQARKAAHLRALATVERRLAEENGDEAHWALAQNYLHKYYQALKERVA